MLPDGGLPDKEQNAIHQGLAGRDNKETSFQAAEAER
jgi:hypothetical protein